MAVTNSAVLDLSDEQRNGLERWLAAFERSWHEGRLAKYVAKLPPSGRLRRAALVEIVKIDLERNWMSGRRPTVEEYAERFPELRTSDGLPLDMIQTEFEARRHAGIAADVNEFCRRFPARQKQLRELLASTGEVGESTGTLAPDRVGRQPFECKPAELRNPILAPESPRPGLSSQPEENVMKVMTKRTTNRYQRLAKTDTLGRAPAERGPSAPRRRRGYLSVVIAGMLLAAIVLLAGTFLPRTKENYGKKPAQAAPVAQAQDDDRPGNAVEYDGLLKLLKDGVSEKDILKQLKDSPTRFVPSAEQVRELRKAGASERLLAALRRDRAAISSDIAEYAVILDCSGSMTDKTPEGQTKMDAAKKAVTDLIRKLPDGKLLTFTVYGHKVFGKDKKRGCEEAVEVVCSGRQLTPKLKDALANAIDTLKPVGWTPLAKAIRDTGEELRKRKTMCEFIVITDGMETCDGDPALEAKQLNRALNLPSGVNVILFGGEDKEKAAVKKIADEGGGKYYDAGSIRDLLRGLDDVKERTKVAAKVKAATEHAARAESSAVEAKEAAATAKKSAAEAMTAAADSAAAKPMADRAQRSARKASAAAVEAWEASGEAKKAADSARGMKSESDAAAQVQIASTAADKAADKAKEARSAAEDTREAVKGVRLALAEPRKPSEEPSGEKGGGDKPLALAPKLVQQLSLPEWQRLSYVAMDISPDGKTLAVRNDSTAELWDLTTGKLRAELKDHPGGVGSLSFSPDGKKLAVGCYKRIFIWDVDKGRDPLILTGHTDQVYFLHFAANGKTFLSLSNDGTGRRWDAVTGDELATVLKNISRHYSRLSPDGKTLFVQSGLLDLDTFKWRILEGIRYRSVEFSRDGKWLAEASDERVGLWDLSTRQYQKIHELHTAAVTSVVLCPDGKTIASGSDDKTVILYDLKAKKARPVIKAHSGPVWVDLLPDGKTLLSVSTSDPTVKFWDIATGAERGSLGHDHNIKWSVLANRLRMLVTVDRQGIVKVWNLAPVGDPAKPNEGKPE